MIRRLLILALMGWMIMDCFHAYSQTDRHVAIDWGNRDPASGQESDFVILVSGEKLFGTILRNYDKTFYAEIQFQTSGGVKTYVPSDLIGFGLDNGQLFQSRQLPGEEQLSFVQLLVSGQLELSEYKGVFFLDDGNTYQKLDSYQRDIVREDKTVQKLYKPYIFIIKTALSGDCAVMLYPRIDRLKYSQDMIIDLLEDYYVCQGLDYTVHVEKIPRLQISPTGGVGISYFSLASTQKREGRNDQLVNNVGYQGFIGVRFHELRAIPRLSIDLRLSYSMFSTQVLSSYEGLQFLWTASEEIKETALYGSLSFNYSLLKREHSELYLGVSGGFWMPNVKTSEGLLDLRFLASQETIVSEVPVTETFGVAFIPGLKMGYRVSINEKLRLFGELQGNIQKEYYRFIMVDNKSDYNRGRVSFQVGLEF